MNDRLPLIFDGHNDQLSLLAADGDPRDAAQRFLRNPAAAIDASRAGAAGFAGGFFAVWVPSSPAGAVNFSAMAKAKFDVALPDPVPFEDATKAAMAQIAVLIELERQGHLRICRTAAAIQDAMREGVTAAILHMEGAEAIDPDLNALDVLYAVGLRSLGPVWSRPNIFGHGVPFRFPSDPDTGPGLTTRGKALVRRCVALGIMLDVSHITERGFWDVARLSNKPLVATHSNAHALCASTRNLTDLQLDAIAASSGVVGVNFAAAFLREDGRMDPDVPVKRILDHIDYLLGRLGEEGVALGSDYDGAIVPQALRGIEGLPKLRAHMRRAGYGEALIEKLCHGNWLRVLRATFGE